MSGLYDLYNTLNSSLAAIKPGSLCFWGEWFGRPHDNIHHLAGCDVHGDQTLVLFFNLGESLIVEKPTRWSLDGGELVIEEAEALRFQWFYYGELPGPDSLHSLNYRRDGTGLDITKPAVRLHAS